MTQLSIVGDTQNATMTSLQIAEATGKRHADVMRDIRVLNEQVEDLGGCIFALSSYKSEQNKELPMYLLNKKECLLLASGYDAKLRLAIINRWEELELAQQPKIPQSFAEALMLAAQQAQQIEEQQKMLEEANEEKEELQICLNESLKYYTVAKYNKEYKCKWNMTKCKSVGKALSRYCRLNSIVVKKCKTNDERFGDVNSYPLTAFVSMMENNKF